MAFVTPVMEYWLEREIAQWGMESQRKQLKTKLMYGKSQGTIKN